MADSADALMDKLRQLATEDTFHNAYARRRAGDVWDRELLAFAIATEIYAVDIRQMREIIKLRPITEVPRVPRFVRGVVTVRGAVIPTIDLRTRLGFETAEPTRHARILICEVDDEPHGLIVDAVRHVVRLRDTDIEAPPAMGGGPETDFIAGIGRDEGELVILLDLPAVVRFSLEGAR